MSLETKKFRGHWPKNQVIFRLTSIRGLQRPVTPRSMPTIVQNLLLKCGFDTIFVSINYPTGSGYTNQIPLHEVGIENISYRDLSCKVAVIEVKMSQSMCQRSYRGSRECQSRHRLEWTCREKCSQENLQAQDSSSGLGS